MDIGNKTLDNNLNNNIIDKDSFSNFIDLKYTN